MSDNRKGHDAASSPSSGGEAASGCSKRSICFFSPSAQGLSGRHRGGWPTFYEPPDPGSLPLVSWQVEVRPVSLPSNGGTDDEAGVSSPLSERSVCGFSPTHRGLSCRHRCQGALSYIPPDPKTLPMPSFCKKGMEGHTARPSTGGMPTSPRPRAPFRRQPSSMHEDEDEWENCEDAEEHWFTEDSTSWYTDGDGRTFSTGVKAPAVRSGPYFEAPARLGLNLAPYSRRHSHHPGALLSFPPLSHSNLARLERLRQTR